MFLSICCNLRDVEVGILQFRTNAPGSIHTEACGFVKKGIANESAATQSSNKCGGMADNQMPVTTKLFTGEKDVKQLFVFMTLVKGSWHKGLMK